MAHKLNFTNVFVDALDTFDLSTFDAFELHPISILNPGSEVEDVEQCDNDEDADFFSVFAHLKSGGLCCLVDVNDRATGERFITLVTALITNADLNSFITK